MAIDINALEGMPDAPEGYRWKLIVRFGWFYRVIAVRQSWPHLMMRDIEGIVLYQQEHGGTVPPNCIIEAAWRFDRELSERDEDNRRREMLREYL